MIFQIVCKDINCILSEAYNINANHNHTMMLREENGYAISGKVFFFFFGAYIICEGGSVYSIKTLKSRTIKQYKMYSCNKSKGTDLQLKWNTHDNKWHGLKNTIKKTKNFQGKLNRAYVSITVHKTQYKHGFYGMYARLLKSPLTFLFLSKNLRYPISYFTDIINESNFLPSLWCVQRQ